MNLAAVPATHSWPGKGGVAGALYVTENGDMFVSVPASLVGARYHVTPLFAESPVTVALKTNEVPCGTPPGLGVIVTTTFGLTMLPLGP